ncbi:MAG TPA: BrnT family toxin [Methyloceanibacter sp.]|nr:BrnT family toxin [Methyloceanibacter sp.]
MFDLARVVGFDWDDGNARKSLDKHGVSQKEAEEVFVNVPLVVAEDVRHSQGEERYRALGKSSLTGDHCTSRLHCEKKAQGFASFPRAG